MSDAVAKVPQPVNEPVKSYAPHTPERAELRAMLDELAGQEVEVPLLIGGKEVRTGRTVPAVMPHRHSHQLGVCHLAGPKEIAQAMAAAREAWREWSSWRWEDRAAIFLKAADLLATTWRARLNAATMLVQSKTPHQAEIDAACELIDFWRFNVQFAQRLYQDQPIQGPGAWNSVEYRPLEGFIYAVTPFNFTSIAGNLPTAPALMGNVSLWKPATSTIYSGYVIARLLEAAGLPPGVVNFMPGRGAQVTEHVLASPDFAGIHFTGSTEVFQSLWRGAGENIASYRTYPRLVGETGGKNFILAHPSADVRALAVAIVRGGYEYQGQKCSAPSRVYVPDSLWPELKPMLLDMIGSLRMGDVQDFSNFMGAVIDRNAFTGIVEYVEAAKRADSVTILAGGGSSDAEGYFIEPTLIETTDPQYVTMCEEIFGPVVTLYVYPERRWAETLSLVDTTSPYALTGAVFATDRKAAREARAALRHAAGNFYVNDKPTGAVVGQQPFGGGRASGTNDKAGSMMNLLRWVSARTIKETFEPATEYEYPFMERE